MKGVDNRCGSGAEGSLALGELVHGYWTQFLKIALAHLLAVASPGPDFAMVVRQSLAHGRRAAIWTSIGIGSAILVHVTYALLGIGILLRTYPVAFTAVKFTGALYLAWIGVTALRSRPRRGLAEAPFGSRAAVTRPAEPAPRSAWTTGFLTNVFNPKATLFFVAIFATLIAPATPQAYPVCLWSVDVGHDDGMVRHGLRFLHAKACKGLLQGGHWIDKVMGVVLIGLALALALASV